MKHRLLWLAGVTMIFLAFIVLGIDGKKGPLKWWGKSPARKPYQQQEYFGSRILIIAPHPDDELLGGAGAIERALATGKKVKAVIMTSGDGYKAAAQNYYHILFPKPEDFRRFGVVRHNESLRALAVLGVKKEDVIFLGYPDGGVNGMWGPNWDYDHLHLGVNGKTHAPYKFSYEKNAPYCGANVVKNLREIIRVYKPTDIVYPDPNDSHHDHWAANAFVKYILTTMDYRAKEWTYLVHRKDFPAPKRYKPALPLEPPERLKKLDTNWLYLALGAKGEKDKLTALKEYHSQRNVLIPFLESFVRKNDLYGTYFELYLPVSKVKPELAKGSFIHGLIHDPIEESFLNKLLAGADITTIGAVYSRERLYLGIQTKEPVNKNIKYNLRLRFFKKDTVSRMDLSLKDKELKSVYYASNSMKLPEETKLLIKKNEIWFDLPSWLLKGAKGFMVSADSFNPLTGKKIDKTAWRLIRVRVQD